MGNPPEITSKYAIGRRGLIFSAVARNSESDRQDGIVYYA